MTTIPRNGQISTSPTSAGLAASKSKNDFNEVRKSFFKKASIVTGISAAGLALGSVRYGITFPAKAIEFLGDSFGAVAGILSPFIFAKNESNNFKLLSSGEKTKTGFTFNNLSDLFYRCCSIGFFPYNFKPFLDTEEIGRSKTSKIITLANIPNLLFTGTLYGLGNLQAVLAWGMRLKEQIKVENLTKELSSANPNDAEKKQKLETELKEASIKEKSYDQLFDSIKRVCTLGSIALPAMYGLRKFGESIETFFTGERPMSELFEKPLIGASRVINLFIGVPETYGKIFDGIARIVQEKEHIKPALPESIGNLIDKFSDGFEGRVTSEKNNIVKASRNVAEIIFHTFSPLAHFAFLAPMFHRPVLNEEAQSRGGLTALADKVLGVYSKGLVTAFIGSYIFVSRLPQSISQTIYFSKYFIGKHLQKKDDTTIQKEVETLQEKIAKNSILEGFSKKVRSTITSLVDNFYTTDHPYGYQTFEEIQVKESIKQAQQVFEESFDGSIVSDEANKKAVIEYCIKYIKDKAMKSYYKLTDKEVNDIAELIDAQLSGKAVKPIREGNTKVAFPGAIFLANFLRSFDFSHRLDKKVLDTRSPFHRMETAYANDELVGFEQELFVVISEAVEGLRKLFNWTMNLEQAR